MNIHVILINQSLLSHNDWRAWLDLIFLMISYAGRAWLKITHDINVDLIMDVLWINNVKNPHVIIILFALHVSYYFPLLVVTDFDISYYA